jgi:hypothetical protein
VACFQAEYVRFEKLPLSVAINCRPKGGLLTERKSAACDHDRYAHADSGIGVESVRRSYKHHDKSCGDNSKVVQDISKDMNDDSVNSQVTVCMLFRWILLLKSAHRRTLIDPNMTYEI